MRVVGSGPDDPIERRRRFEVARPEVTILPPATLNDRWRAIVPMGVIPAAPEGTTIDAWQLADLMDQVDAIFGQPSA